MTLNLSCGKCKVIRSFSGMPPTCDVCGWVCIVSSVPQAEATVQRYLTAKESAASSGTTRSDSGQFATQPESSPPYKPKPASIGEVLGGAAGCLGMLLVLAFYAGCALVVIAAIVWAWHYLFG